MSLKRNNSRIFITFLTGLAIGAVLGIMFAPKSGKELRNDLSNDTKRLVETGKDSVSEIVEKTKRFAESGKEKIEELKDIFQ
jgi:gas vesicle protein